MDKITFTTPLSDDEADEYERRMEALFGGGAEEPERFESNLSMQPKARGLSCRLLTILLCR